MLYVAQTSPPIGHFILVAQIHHIHFRYRGGNRLVGQPWNRFWAESSDCLFGRQHQATRTCSDLSIYDNLADLSAEILILPCLGQM